MESWPHEWQLRSGIDSELHSRLTDHLVEYNTSQSEVVEARFTPGNLAAEPVHAYVVDESNVLIGGCTGRVERVWHWLSIDLLWVASGHRGSGIGSATLSSVEDQARRLGCRWSDVTTFDFQAPGFYRRNGYVEYGVKADYPPGHSNHFLRKAL